MKLLEFLEVGTTS